MRAECVTNFLPMSCRHVLPPCPEVIRKLMILLFDSHAASQLWNIENDTEPPIFSKSRTRAQRKEWGVATLKHRTIKSRQLLLGSGGLWKFSCFFALPLFSFAHPPPDLGIIYGRTKPPPRRPQETSKPKISTPFAHRGKTLGHGMY